MKRLTLAAIVLLSVATSRGLADTGPLGRSGLTATYRLGADANRRPDYEQRNREAITELHLTIGLTAKHNGQEYQWFELSFVKQNGRRCRLWLLLDRSVIELNVSQGLSSWNESQLRREEHARKTEISRSCKRGVFGIKLR